MVRRPFPYFIHRNQTVTPLIASLLSYGFMLVAYQYPHRRLFHIPTMAAIIIFDLSMPLFLMTHRNWWHRLIEVGDLFSFLVWMHFGLLITLYTLEVMQALTGIRILRGNPSARSHHHEQAKAVLIVRALALVTGGFLA